MIVKLFQDQLAGIRSVPHGHSQRHHSGIRFFHIGLHLLRRPKPEDLFIICNLTTEHRKPEVHGGLKGGVPAGMDGILGWLYNHNRFAETGDTKRVGAMLWFEERLISQLRPDDIQGLIGKIEDDGIEFKAKPYLAEDSGTTKKDAENKVKFELCCDVAAFANSGLGYIVIGIQEKNRKAVMICPIKDPQPVIERIHKICLDGIEPRPDFSIEPVPVKPSGTVIVIRIPKGNTLHMVSNGNRTHFCKRYRDGKREMTYVEITEEFQSAASMGLLREVNAKLGELLSRTAGQPPKPITAEDDALLATSPEEVQRIMEERLMKEGEQ